MTMPIARDLPAEAFDRTPRLQLTFTDETCWLTRFDDRGAPVSTYPVAVADVAPAFKEFGVGTGLLPADVVFWQTVRGQARLGVWLPPAVRTLSLAVGKRVERLTVPMPGFVFTGQGHSYWIHAAQRRPNSERDQLYLAPLPNVHVDGAVCVGSVKFPRCSAATIAAAAALFFESDFNRDLSDHKVQDERTLYHVLRSLRGRRAFPERLLVPAHSSLRQLMQGVEGDIE
jgi:PRTRC genetic system protein B